MNTQPSVETVRAGQEQPGSSLDLQTLLDDATSRLQEGAVLTALELVELAWTLYQEPRLEPIMEGLRSSLGDSRWLAEVCLREAELAMEIGDHEAAETALRQARELEPESPLVLNAMGWFLASRGDLAGAQVAYMDVVRLRPASAEAHANLAGICLRRGLRERAVHHLRRTLALDASHATARSVLSSLDAGPEARVSTAAPVLVRRGEGLTESVWIGFAFPDLGL